MRLKHDVWSGEISFSRTQRAEKRMGFRGKAGRRMGQQEGKQGLG